MRASIVTVNARSSPGSPLAAGDVIHVSVTPPGRQSAPASAISVRSSREDSVFSALTSTGMSAGESCTMTSAAANANEGRRRVESIPRWYGRAVYE